MASVIRGDDNFDSDDVVTALDLTNVGGISYGENYTELLSSDLYVTTSTTNITGNGAGNYLISAYAYYNSATPYIGFEGINSSTVETVKHLKVDGNGSISLRVVNDATFANTQLSFSLPQTYQPTSLFELYVSGNGEFGMKRVYGSGYITVTQIWKVT